MAFCRLFCGGRVCLCICLYALKSNDRRQFSHRKYSKKVEMKGKEDMMMSNRLNEICNAIALTFIRWKLE